MPEGMAAAGKHPGQAAALDAGEADFVVIGAGAAGCVLANRLTASGRHSVRLLEAGGPDRHPWIKVPAGFSRTIHNKSLNWGYVTAASAGTAERAIPFPRGRVVGGSSSINGHLYVRGQAADYDLWAQRGCRGWSWEEVLPYFRRAETRPGGDPALRGHDGPLSVTDQADPHPLTTAFLEAATRLGLPRNPDYNSGNQEGCFLYQQLLRGGRRWSAADAYLRPALRRPELQMTTRALVEGIAFEGRRATGVFYRRGDTRFLVRARRQVVLAAGAINSPHLLQLSGIGDPDWLMPLGIPVRQAMPEVGRNLRDHYAARIAVRLRGAASLNERAHGLRLMREVLRYAISRRGILATSPAHGGAFLRTRPELAYPDLQLLFAPASYSTLRFGAGLLEREPGMTCGAAQLRPESHGHVRALSTDPAALPEIQPNYLADPMDQATLLAGLRFVRTLFRTEPLAAVVDHETFPGASMPDEALLDHARRTGATVYHPVGTCRMGSDPGAVVDPSLRVPGFEGLRICDASVMPTMVSGNTYAATVMIAEKASDILLAGT
ncbi:GMC family oxidoreductase [Roseomonas chloroacetimidivorans]|uniref:GMC family oxidoreductase n=1 Tax=Roseomonas chloroacetimidivorans TaxID=1766656 RepID=UPI003C7911ED